MPGKHKKDVLSATVAAAGPSLASTGSPKVGQIAAVGAVLPQQLEMLQLMDLHAPING